MMKIHQQTVQPMNLSLFLDSNVTAEMFSFLEDCECTVDHFEAHQEASKPLSKRSLKAWLSAMAQQLAVTQRCVMRNPVEEVT